MVCTRTLCNERWAGSLSPSAAEVPEALKRKHANLGRRISLQKKRFAAVLRDSRVCLSGGKGYAIMIKSCR